MSPVRSVALHFAASALLPLLPAAAAPVDPDAERLTALQQHLAALTPGVRPDEAQQLARSACRISRQLARRYHAVGPPQLHNSLVNAGIKKRGLCHHWARDLGEQLAALKLRTLVLRWAIARRGTLREHNAVVVTARGQRFDEGIVLDAWRHCGRLFAGPVAGDKYPWREDPHERFEAAGVR